MLSVCFINIGESDEINVGELIFEVMSICLLDFNAFPIIILENSDKDSDDFNGLLFLFESLKKFRANSLFANILSKITIILLNTKFLTLI